MEPRGINYLYFGAYFLLLVLCSASGIFAKENSGGSTIFFFLYAAGQAALETGVLIFLGSILQKCARSLLFYFFIGATFLFLVFHIIDFLVGRILDLSVWETIAFVSDETWESFLYLLDASGVPIWAWFLIFGIIAALPLLGIFLFRLSEKITQKKPLPFRMEPFFILFFALPAALLFWDASGSRAIHPDAYTAFIQSLPWKFTFLEPESVSIPLNGRLRKAPSESEVAKAIDEYLPVPEKKPNIYLFVIESLRADIIDAETAPHLNNFRAGAAPIDLTLANTNCSHMGWFSIFHSQYSYLWNDVQKNGWEMGSPPLYLLKKWGYKIHLYSSAQLGYYGMEQLLFGKESRLLDSSRKFPHAPPTSAAETDAEALLALFEDIANNPDQTEGQVFIVFLDSTHFDYSWPKNFRPKFIPFATELAYFKAFYSKNRIEKIKNRYRNAVRYIDSLFGSFLANIPNRDEAIILFTGDHGEEFFEKGHLFHGSHLIQEQTRIPLYMKFGAKRFESKRPMATQMDIFPSVIDYLSGNAPDFLEGQSIFRETKSPFAFLSRFNAGRTPYEFCLHNGQHKMIARFSNRSDVFRSNALQIRSLRTSDDQPLRQIPKIDDWVRNEFGFALDYLFNREKGPLPDAF
jgi:hypothetical protein